MLADESRSSWIDHYDAMNIDIIRWIFLKLKSDVIISNGNLRREWDEMSRN